jgi:IclR family acetate operon transcriptional repressor
MLKLAHNAVGTGQFDLRAEARSVLKALAQQSGETTNLVTLLDSHAVYVDQVASRHMVGMFTQIGTRVPLYCTGAGKALLAFRGAAEIEAYLAREPLQPHTPQTLTTHVALHDELERIRQRGYAHDEGELDAEVRCVAAPVFDHTGGAVAAISVSGPASRFTAARMRTTGLALLRATQELSARLGYRGREPDSG